MFFYPFFRLCFNLLLMKDGLFVSSAAHSVQYPVALAACEKKYLPSLLSSLLSSPPGLCIIKRFHLVHL